MKETLLNSSLSSELYNNLDIHFVTGTTNISQAAPLSAGSTTSFCSCLNAIKSAVSIKKEETSNAVALPKTNDIPVCKKYESRACQTNLDKEVTVELAVFHGDKKVVSEIFEFPNSSVNNETVMSQKSFEIYYEVVNEEMLQIWGVEKDSDAKGDDRLDPVRIRHMIHNAESEEAPILELKNCLGDAEKQKLHTLVYRTKEHAERCKSIILEKYDEIWTMLNKVTNEALDEVVAKEKELVDLIEEVSERGINTTDYDTILSSINCM